MAAPSRPLLGQHTKGAETDLLTHMEVSGADGIRFISFDPPYHLDAERGFPEWMMEQMAHLLRVSDPNTTLLFSKALGDELGFSFLPPGHPLAAHYAQQSMKPVVERAFRKAAPRNRAEDGLESLLAEARAVADGETPDDSQRDAIAAICDRASALNEMLRRIVAADNLSGEQPTEDEIFAVLDVNFRPKENPHG